MDKLGTSFRQRVNIKRDLRVDALVDRREARHPLPSRLTHLDKLV